MAYKLVEFSDESYGIREYWGVFNHWAFKGLEDKVPEFLRSYVDLETPQHRWSQGSIYFQCCRTYSLPTCVRLLKQLEPVKGERKC